jgi:PPM family protein phosphatase
MLFDDELGLYIVADGVGGNAKGEVASAESVELVHSWVKRWRKTLDAHIKDPTEGNSGMVRRLLESAVQSACYMVFGMGQLDPRQKGMSSTLSS